LNAKAKAPTGGMACNSDFGGCVYWDEFARSEAPKAHQSLRPSCPPIMLVALGFNLLGDGFCDALDPTLRR